MVRIYTYLELYLSDIYRSISLSEFEKYFKIPHQTIKAHLAEFVKAKVLKEEKRERSLLYRLNIDNPLTKEYMILCEKERLLTFLETDILFARLYQEISPFFSDSKILLFGSCVEKKEYKDIDILIISKNKHIKQTLKKFQDTYSKKIHIIQTTERDLTKTFIKELQQKHMIFNNHDDFVQVIYS